MTGYIKIRDAVAICSSMPTLGHAIHKIMCMPSADVMEVVHGKWELYDDGTLAGYCSACGWESHLYEDDVIGMPYCPHCGARMDGDEND